MCLIIFFVIIVYDFSLSTCCTREQAKGRICVYQPRSCSTTTKFAFHKMRENYDSEGSFLLAKEKEKKKTEDVATSTHEDLRRDKSYAPS